jgi:hypothetical protein
VVVEEAEGEAAAPAPVLISRKAIALVERAAASHTREVNQLVVVEEGVATVAATEVAAAAEVEEVACVTTFSVVTAPGGLHVASHTRKELPVVVEVSAEVAEAVDGAEVKTRTARLAVPRALLLVFATTSKKDGVLANLADFPMMKQRQHPEVLVAVAAALLLKVVVEAFASLGRKENALVVMNVALPMLKNGF